MLLLYKTCRPYDNPFRDNWWLVILILLVMTESIANDTIIIYCPKEKFIAVQLPTTILEVSGSGNSCISVIMIEYLFKCHQLQRQPLKAYETLLHIPTMKNSVENYTHVTTHSCKSLSMARCCTSNKSQGRGHVFMSMSLEFTCGNIHYAIRSLEIMSWTVSSLEF